MRGDIVWLSAAVFSVSLAGFVLLALASERPGELLLGRIPGRRERLVWRGAGWLLLAMALALCQWVWGWSIGVVAWLGWLCVTSTVLVFALPRWVEKHKKAKPDPASPVQPPTRSRLGRTLVILLLVVAPLIFAWGIYSTPVKPVQRDYVIQRQVGHWSVALVETHRGPPRGIRHF